MCFPGVKVPMSRKNSWPVWTIVVATFLTTSPVGADPADTTGELPSDAIEVQLRNGLLTLDARGAPLGEVIRAIGEESGFKTAIEGVVDTPVERSLVAIPLETGLRYLLDDVPHVMFYPLPKDGESSRQLREIRLYGREPETAQLPPFASESDAVMPPISAEPGARMRAIRESARSTDQGAISSLGRVLHEDDDPGMRGLAARELGEIGGDSALPALQSALEDTEESVRIRAIRALAQIDSDRATRLLGEMLLEGPERRSRMMAAWALGNRGGPVAESYLEEALEDSDELIRQGVEHALSQMRRQADQKNTMSPHGGRQ